MSGRRLTPVPGALPPTRRGRGPEGTPPVSASHSAADTPTTKRTSRPDGSAPKTESAQGRQVPGDLVMRATRDHPELRRALIRVRLEDAVRGVNGVEGAHVELDIGDTLVFDVDADQVRRAAWEVMLAASVRVVGRSGIAVQDVQQRLAQFWAIEEEFRERDRQAQRGKPRGGR